MEDLYKALDAFVIVAAAVGGAFAIYWIYNSTNKERRALTKKVSPARDPAYARQLRQGIFFQRVAFAAASLVTGAGITAFSFAYAAKRGHHIAPAYLAAAAVFALVGIVVGLLAFINWRKEERSEQK
jgi:hypothetical protein